MKKKRKRADTKWTTDETRAREGCETPCSRCGFRASRRRRLQAPVASPLRVGGGASDFLWRPAGKLRRRRYRRDGRQARRRRWRSARRRYEPRGGGRVSSPPPTLPRYRPHRPWRHIVSSVVVRPSPVPRRRRRHTSLPAAASTRTRARTRHTDRATVRRTTTTAADHCHEHCTSRGITLQLVAAATTATTATTAAADATTTHHIHTPTVARP